LSAIKLVNSSKITIKNLKLVGGGYKLTTMETHGIEMKCDSATSALSDFLIDAIDVSGYGGHGIYFNVQNTTFGFNNIRITNSVLHENGMTGLLITGSWDVQKNLIRYSNNNVYVGYNVAYKNHGRSDYKDNWSGSGILVAGTINGLVEYCEAYENGYENGCATAGPVGIWTDDSKDVIIQHSTSHHNKGGAAMKDGGGFDIDGGCTGCVIQYCKSFENEGPGYAMFQWNTGNKWIHDTIRFNTSTNDGRNNYYGSITAWGQGSDYKINEADVYGNQVNLNKPGKAIGFIGGNFNNIRIYNNQFCLENGAEFSPVVPSQVYITDNIFRCGEISQQPPDTTQIPIDTTIADTIPAPVDKNVRFDLYPNPAHNIINIHLANIKKGSYQLRLMNVSGFVVYSRAISVDEKYEDQNINIGNQANGIYTLQLIGSNSQMLKRVLIQ
jgi:hypothetical protein